MDFNKLDSNIKNNYDLELEYREKMIGYSINIYFGKNKVDKENCIIVKNIDIDLSKIQNYEITQIKQDIFLLSIFNNKEYFPKLKDILLSEDRTNIYIIIEGNNVSLDKFIMAKNYNYKKERNLVKFILYQITYGLYILHSNKIIHHNLKSPFILINQNAEISIYNFLSAIHKREKSVYYSPSYAAPEFFIPETKIDEKYDMWSLGVLMVELYLRKLGYFRIKEDQKSTKKENNINQLNTILSKFEIKEIDRKKDVYTLMRNILNDQTEAKFKIEEIVNEIDDLDAIEIINNLLEINPKKRISAEQLLRTNYFKDFRDISPLNVESIISSLNFNEIDKIINDKFKSIDIIYEINKK